MTCRYSLPTCRAPDLFRSLLCPPPPPPSFPFARSSHIVSVCLRCTADADDADAACGPQEYIRQLEEALEGKDAALQEARRELNALQQAVSRREISMGALELRLPGRR